HLDQQLVERLLALIVAAAQAGATLATDRVDFIDENDARGLLLGVLEHIANTRRTHTDEHLNEIRARDAEERHLGFTGYRLRKQGLTGSRRTNQQHAAGDAPAQPLKLGGIAQEVDQFGDIFLGFVAPGYISERDVIGAFIQHAGARFAEAERAALATALHLAHEEDPDADQQQHREPGDE